MTPSQDKLYRVKDITPTMIYTDNGSVDGFRIDFSVAGSKDQYILVPRDEFDPDKVNETVADWAAKIAAVLSIEGPDVYIDQHGHPLPPGATE
jgi:hypothetical protein